MNDDIDLRGHAQRALEAMLAQGFEHAQAGARVTRLAELNFELNVPSLLRSTETHRLALLGLVGGRKAATELSDFSEAALREAVAALHADVLGAPADEANAVSAGQQADIVQGPQAPDLDLLAAKVQELLDFRARETPGFQLKEGSAAHTLVRSHTVTSGGSALASRVGAWSLAVSGSAREGGKTSSFNYAGGDTHDMAAQPAAAQFGIDAMMREAERQTNPRPLGGNFTGDVVLTPNAVADVLEWLQGQIGDERLIPGTSLYAKRVGERIASPLLSLRSRFDSPGVAAISADAFATPPLQVLDAGVLKTLTPSLYGSRKTRLPHMPVAAAGWAIDAGATPLTALLAGVERGVLVGRLSMGSPGPNGDFSGVVKNSFLLEGGRVGAALSGAMAAGNMAQMLEAVLAVSAERIDTGAWCLPWLRIGGLHFS
jgi:PmbA protein